MGSNADIRKQKNVDIQNISSSYYIHILTTKCVYQILVQRYIMEAAGYLTF